MENKEVVKEDTTWYSNDKNTIWMPKKEYDAWESLRSKRSEEQLRQQSYFFWNNFSMNGYDDYVKKLNDKKDDNKE